MTILQEVWGEIRSSFSGILESDDTTTLTVAKPFCAPARYIVTATLPKYGVKILSYKERTHFVSVKDFMRRMRIEMRQGENLQYGPFAAPGFLAMAQVAKVKVKRSQAVWAEYLILRTGQLYIQGEYQHPRNQEWAERHGGRMPPAWKDGVPWVEASCSEGVRELAYLKQVTQPVNQKR